MPLTRHSLGAAIRLRLALPERQPTKNRPAMFLSNTAALQTRLELIVTRGREAGRRRCAR